MDDTSASGRRRRKTRATINDVAELAGVSVASVSRFMNAPESVSQVMGERIAMAVRKTDFQLRRGRQSPVLAAPTIKVPHIVVLLSLGQHSAKELLSMPIFPHLISGIQRGLEAVHSTLMYAHFTGEGPLPPAILDGAAQGILVHANDFNRAMSPELARVLLGTPSVWIMREHCDPACRIDRAFYNNDLVGRLAAEHLISTGARSLAFINNLPDHNAYRRRRVDFTAAAREVGVPVTAYEVGTAGIESFHDALKRVMDQAKPPDALFVPSDDQLLEAFHLLRGMGVEPERQIRLMGCNNDPNLMVRMTPRPATIDIHLDQIGQRGVEQLIARFNNPRAPSVQIYVSPTVIPATSG